MTNTIFQNVKIKNVPNEQIQIFQGIIVLFVIFLSPLFPLMIAKAFG